MDGQGLRVLLVPGMGCRAEVLAPFSRWLEWLGFRPVIVAPGDGVGCGEWSTTELVRSLRKLTDDGRDPAIVIAHSRGGQFARAAALRVPQTVDSLITLGTPTIGLLTVRPALITKLVLLGALGSSGVGGVLGIGCWLGSCCRDLRRQRLTALPPHIRFVSVFSRQDGVVRWTKCLSPGARLLEVPSSHSGLLSSQAVFDTLEDELRTIAGRRLGVSSWRQP